MSPLNPGVFLRNFRDYDAPLGVKLRLLMANNWRKVSTASGCCGHHGEPGC
jgi:hypothetical protein